MNDAIRSTRPTLRDVARLAAVSVMTVSNVVNGKTERVGQDVDKRVRQAISDLNYRPHHRGRSLRLARGFSIGLVVLHPDRRFLNDPLNTEVAAGMSNFLASEGYGLMIVGAQTINELELRLSRLAELDAIAVFGFGDQPERKRLYRLVGELGLPILLIGDDLVDGLADASFVRQENEEGAFRLAKYVLESGAQNLLFIRPDHVWPAMNQRERGIRTAAKGLAGVTVLKCSEVRFGAIVRAVKDRLLQDPSIDAVMGGNDMFGIAALHAARELARHVPSELFVTGFNGFAFRDYTNPLLTSVLSPSYELGQEAARQLLDRVVIGRFRVKGTVLPVQQLNGQTVDP